MSLVLRVDPPAYQVDFTGISSGKHIAPTKRRIRWVFGFANPSALIAGLTGVSCRGEEHEVQVTWSVTSGKHEVTVNGVEIHKSTSSQHTLFEGRFDFTFDIGAHIVQLILHAGKPLRKGGGETMTDHPWRMYDLFVNGQSFFDFLKVYQLGENEDGISNSTGQQQQYSQYLYRPSVERVNHPIRNYVPTDTSEPPDEIQGSRSVNEPSRQRSMSSAHQQFDDDVSLMSYDLPPRSDDSRVPAPPTWEELQGYNFRGLNTPASFERQQSVDSIASQQPGVTVSSSAAASRSSTNGGGDGRVPVVPSVSTVPTHLEYQTGIPHSTKEEEEADLIDLGGPDLIDLGRTDPTEQFVNVSNGYPPPITNPLHDYVAAAASSNTNSSAFMNVVSPPPPTFHSLKEEQFVNLSDDYPPPPPPPVTKPPSPFAFMHDAFNHNAPNGSSRQPHYVRNATASSFARSNGDVSREDIMGRYQNTPSNQPPVYFSTDTSSTAQPPPPATNMSMNNNHNGNVPYEEKKDDGNNNINDLDNAMKNLVNLNDGLNNPSINPAHHRSRARRINTSAARGSGGGHGNIMDRPPSSYSLNELKTMYSQRFNQNQGSSDVNEGYYSSVLAGR